MAHLELRTRKRASNAEILAAMQKIKVFFKEAKECFVGRDHEIDLLMVAVIQAQHVLFFGPPGTAKTAMAREVLGNIQGGKYFRTEMSPFMGPDTLFGPYNTKLMREEGTLHHNTTDTLADASMARIGEALDANPATLRTLLGVLNEREFVRGSQRLDVPLHTVFLDTNEVPKTFLAKNPKVFAMLDRISLIAEVDYVSSAEDLTRIVDLFQEGGFKKMKSKLDLETIMIVSDRIANPPSMITDKYVLKAYGRVAHAYREERKQLVDDKGIFPQISDRRIANASQMMEVAAMIDERLIVILPDLAMCHYVLCSTDAEREIWNRLVQSELTQYKELKRTELAELQSDKIESLAETLDEFDLDAVIATSDVVVMKNASDDLRQLLEQLQGLNPENEGVEKTANEQITKVNAMLTSIKEAIIDSF